MAKGRPRRHIAPCRFCNKRFKRLEHLQRHERIHTLEKPFKCACGAEFSRRDLLVRHTRLTHTQPSSRVDDSSADPDAGTSTLEGRQVAQSRFGNVESSIISAGGLSIPDDTYLASHLDVPTQVASTGIVASPQSQNHAQLASTAMTLPTPLAPTHNPEVDYVDNSFDVDSMLEPSDTTALDFFWNDNYGVNAFLPAAFFNTDYSLTELSENRVDIHQADCDNLRLPAGYSAQQTALSSSAQLDGVPVNPVNQNNATSIIEWPLDPELQASDEADLVCPWRISPSAYEQLKTVLLPYQNLLSTEFSLPTRHTLSRFLEGYFRGFHEHLPFLHVPTISAATMAPELLLAIASVGALYKFEHVKGYALYFASKAIIDHKFQISRKLLSERLTISSSINVNFSSSQPALTSHASPGFNQSGTNTDQSPEPTMDEEDAELQIMQALLILTAMCSWADKALVPEALEMAGQLAVLARTHAKSIGGELASCTDWPRWIAYEGKRRMISGAYIVLNLQSIAFNVPPMIINQEIMMFLPCSGKEWKAKTSRQWRHARTQHESQELCFQTTLRRLLRGEQIEKNCKISAFGNNILIHAIVQQILFERHASSYQASESPSLRPEALKAFESALRAWQKSWETAGESTLDPMSPKGPMGFNSTALLRIAYVRLNADLGPNLRLDSRDPYCVARSFMDESVKILTRSAHVDRAVLQCIHALSIPVRSGIPFVARTHTQPWSVVHSLANLECAFLLGRWLAVVVECVRGGGLSILREDERKLLCMLKSLVLETDLGHGFRESDDELISIRKLTAYTICLWAEIFQGAHVFQIVRVVGRSLAIVGDHLRLELES